MGDGKGGADGHMVNIVIMMEMTMTGSSVLEIC